MNKIELKSEIQKVLDQVPESVLEEVLELLKDIQFKTPNEVRTTDNLRRILSEDRELLRKLAR